MKDKSKTQLNGLVKKAEPDEGKTVLEEYLV